ncbi:MAG: NifB/NifX family molybdenum-iron cluster-binding protein [Campylobacterota bacterium]|nr:NifB/NifX family molybdenum-iron cluster-binding protein [Campylobacterota bacterium]
MKIIIPVGSQEREIFQRIGRAPFFAVYENDTFVELRVNSHAASHDHHTEGEGHGGHHHGKGEGRGGHHHHEGPMEAYSKEEVAHHKKDLGNLKDINCALSRAIGPNMKEALESSGIKVIKIRKKDGEYADEVIENYFAGTLSKAV